MLVNPILEAAVPDAALALAGGIWWKRRPNGARRAKPDAAPEPQALAPLTPEPEMASRIIVGLSADQPAFELVMSHDELAQWRSLPAVRPDGIITQVFYDPQTASLKPI